MFVMIVTAILIIVLATANEVDAAPDPCLIWNHRHRHHEKTTTPQSEIDETGRKQTINTKKKLNKLEKLIGEWIFPDSSESAPPPKIPTTAPKEPIEEFLSNYMKFISYLFSF